MSAKRLTTIVLAVWSFVLFANSAAPAQSDSEKLDVIREKMEQMKDVFEQMPEEERRILSGSAQNLMQLAEHWTMVEPEVREMLSRPDELGAAFSLGGPFSLSGLARQMDEEPGSDNSKLIQVSDPSTDFKFSLQTGFTQSETSTAWCGRNVVVGFNDSGSFPESIRSGPGGLSFNGFARSADQGRSFQDLGFLTPGPNRSNFLLGDPVLGCTDENTFYYASIFQTGTFPDVKSVVSISKSTDGGSTFGNPAAAVSKNLIVRRDSLFFLNHFLDKPWMAIDPSNANRIFVTYTDFDSSGEVCGFFPPRPGFTFRTAIPRAAIELVSSADGGSTWNSPVVINELCGFGSVQGSQVAVGPAGELYVAWEFFPRGIFFGRELRVRKSTNHGVSFGPIVKVDDVTCVGDCNTLQGLFRTFLDLGSVVVDRSGTATNGNVYITWHDGRNLRVPSFTVFGFSGTYNYADVLLSRSTDGGATWSRPVRVNTNEEPLPNGRGSDQYQPGAAVDNTGTVSVCFYDRRLDRFNYLVDRFCAVSTDAGATWANKRRSAPSWAPIHATDFQINTLYLGDYDSLASDFTGVTPGFVGAFQFFSPRPVFVPNPDVKATRFLTGDGDDGDLE